ncbi:hypothetical protein JG687_00009336 [Phytophthora cactorum]|uniref:RxLR effector protein n=1 Tax=Phytophthora cactorum TaxID=29920 RepID=A0A8T1UBI2_9STRA|nr:hypothetical protein PC121_g5591 [Phytophthora cactorum]KAG4053218.1 hypothetical protein PC123_g11628 [Phytophthora cactorum]KAG6958510.1 hypothetical protein JG687_00009336 [Phytophthora cactorum]
MRVAIVVLAALLASCDAISTTKSGRTKVSLMIATDNTQPAGAVENDITSKRFLRTAKTVNDGEERGFEALKSLLPGTKMLA